MVDESILKSSLNQPEQRINLQAMQILPFAILQVEFFEQHRPCPPPALLRFGRSSSLMLPSAMELAARQIRWMLGSSYPLSPKEHTEAWKHCTPRPLPNSFFIFFKFIFRKLKSQIYQNNQPRYIDFPYKYWQISCVQPDVAIVEIQSTSHLLILSHRRLPQLIIPGRVGRSSLLSQSAITIPSPCAIYYL